MQFKLRNVAKIFPKYLNFLTSLNAMLKNNTVLTFNDTGTVYILLYMNVSISWDGSSVWGGISCCCLIMAVNFFNFNKFSANWLKLCFWTSFTLWSCGSIVEYICWTFKSLSCSNKVFSISDHKQFLLVQIYVLL